MFASEIALKTKEIDEKLARMNPTEWPVPSSRKVQMIALYEKETIIANITKHVIQ